MVPTILLLPGLMQASPPGMDCQERVVVFLKTGPNWDQRGQVFPKHVEHIGGLLKKGVLLEAGPLEDGRAMAIYNTADPAAAEAAAKADPFVLEQVTVFDSRAMWQRCVAAKPN